MKKLKMARGVINGDLCYFFNLDYHTLIIAAWSLDIQTVFHKRISADVLFVYRIYCIPIKTYWLQVGYIFAEVQTVGEQEYYRAVPVS